MDLARMQQYADFIVRVGVNVRPGQNFLIHCPVEGAEMARACARAGYAAGAKRVIVRYGDEQIDRITMEHCAEEVLCDIKPHQLRSYLDYAEDEGGVCTLSISSRDPEIYKGLDGEKIQKANLASRAALQPWREYTMASRIQWCIAAIPTVGWARKVFPGLPDDEAVEKLWDAIFDVCRVKAGGDVVAEWQRHVERTAARRDQMNQLDLVSVHLEGENGTDLVIGLADDSTWEGASEYTQGTHIPFIANIPTEEVFTAPHKDRVDGVVKSTRPYVYNGELIEDFTVWFEKGRVVKYEARRGEELLGKLLDSDEGARSIGEIALVPASSPIRRSGVLFYNTLFDENAACHIAFGRGYPTNIRGGADMTTAQLLEKGLNDSAIHEDVMVGSEKMNITGLTRSGETVQIFRDGEWAF
ncbi:MAG TPA: aminopeptidase [Candidatus Anaerofilum faecale]|nr:aminopeptidase [Candidatus Anaerofilum faecale]